MSVEWKHICLCSETPKWSLDIVKPILTWLHPMLASVHNWKTHWFFSPEYFRIQILIKRPWPCNGGWGHTSYFYGIKTRSTFMTKMKNREPLHLLIGIFGSRRYIPSKQQDEKPLNAGWPLHHFLDRWSPSIHAEVKVPLRKHSEISQKGKLIYKKRKVKVTQEIIILRLVTWWIPMRSWKRSSIKWGLEIAHK